MVRPARGNRSPKQDDFGEIASPHSRPEAKKQYPTNTAVPKEVFSVTTEIDARFRSEVDIELGYIVVCKGSLRRPKAAANACRSYRCWCRWSRLWTWRWTR